MDYVWLAVQAQNTVQVRNAWIAILPLAINVRIPINARLVQQA